MSDKREEIAHDVANEQVLLAVASRGGDKAKALIRSVSPDQFLLPAFTTAWRALRRLVDAGAEPTPEALRRAMVEVNAAADDVAAIEVALRSPPPSRGLDFHVGALRWDATRARVLNSTLPPLVEGLKDPGSSPDTIKARARAVSAALEASGRSRARRPGDVYREYRADFTARRATGAVYPLGAPAFDDKMTEGFAPTRTTVLAGLSSSGKTTVALAWALMLARQGRRVAVGAWEMPVTSTMDVMICSLTGLSLVSVVRGQLTDDEAARVDKAARWISSRVKFVENIYRDARREHRASNVRGRITNDHVVDLLEGYLAESGCDVWIYDMWDRILPEGHPEAVTHALYRMQELHQEYGIHGVIVNQINLKDVERRRDKRPTRDAVKGVGSFVEVADYVLGVHREAMFKQVEDDTLETICLKQRRGSAFWCVRWRWDGARCQIWDPEEVPYDSGLDSTDLDLGDLGAIKTSGGARRRRRRDT